MGHLTNARLGSEGAIDDQALTILKSTEGMVHRIMHKPSRSSLCPLIDKPLELVGSLPHRTGFQHGISAISLLYM